MRITLSLIFILIIFFIIQLAIPGFTEAFYLEPSLVSSQPWLLITSVFLHGGISHIAFNCFSLFMFGTILERRLSIVQYLSLFILAGIAGSVLYWLTWVLGIIPDIPALGASGAIFGILGACAVFFPNLMVYIYFFPIKIQHAAVLWFVLEFVGAFNTSSGIASAGHLGGLIIGILYAWYLQNGQKRYDVPAWAQQ